MDSSGELLPPGEEGEIVVRGPSVMGAYANDPEANQAAFRDGWFRTGDIGRLDSGGFLFVTGRSKEMINRGGQKIVPEDVDRVLAAHPAVLDAAAFAVPHPTLGEDIACAVVPQPDSRTSEAELRRFASQKLTSFKVPRRIYFVDQIPRGRDRQAPSPPSGRAHYPKAGYLGAGRNRQSHRPGRQSRRFALRKIRAEPSRP